MPQTTDTLQSPPLSAFESKAFTLKIGKHPNVFALVLNKDVATFYSGFFEAAMKKDTFKEGKESVIALPEETPAAYTAFVIWMITRQLHGVATDEGLWPALRLWAAAERAMAPMLVNILMDHIRTKMLADGTRVTSKQVSYVYKNSVEGNSMRAFIIAVWWACARAPLEQKKETADLPTRAFSDALLVAAEDFPTGVPWETQLKQMNVCHRFHVHAADEKKCAN